MQTHHHIGAIAVSRVLDLEGPFMEPAMLLPESDPDTIGLHRSWLQPHFLDPASGRFIMAFQGYVVRTEHHTIVVDTCIGHHKDRPLHPAWHRRDSQWLERLKALGVHPEQVDFVMCTHLHPDHVGWNTLHRDGRWVPTFPNAKYVFSRTELAFWQQNLAQQEHVHDGAYADSVLPIVEAGRAIYVEDGHTIDDRVSVEMAAGHSPGHYMVGLSSNEHHAVITGDLMHHPVQCAEPQWNSRFCHDPQASRAIRKAFLQRYAGTSTKLMPAHFATPAVGTLVDTAHGVRFATAA